MPRDVQHCLVCDGTVASSSKKPRVCSGIQKRGMGERCSEEGTAEAAGWRSSHVLLTSAKSCPKLQPRKFPVRLSANQGCAQADPAAREGKELQTEQSS